MALDSNLHIAWCSENQRWEHFTTEQMNSKIESGEMLPGQFDTALYGYDDFGNVVEIEACSLPGCTC